MFVMWIFTSLILLMAQGCTASGCDSGIDPCYLYNNVEVPDMNSRDPSTQFSAATVSLSYCDKYALSFYTWYRSDYNMTTQCILPQTCGTNYPIWINGSIPAYSEGIVTRTACLRTFAECCGYTYNVQMKNCIYYTVYCLPDTPASCHERYCFDVGTTYTTTTTENSQTTAKSTTTTTTTTTTDSNEVTTLEGSTHGDNKARGSSTSDKLVVAAMTIVACTVIFGVVLGLVIYFMRRKIHPYTVDDKSCIHCQEHVYDSLSHTRMTKIDVQPPPFRG